VRYAHGDLATVWARLRDGIRSGTVSSHERVFVTRSTAKRSCRNRAEVEAYFATRRFHVVHPETMALADQVELFAGATVVAGFGGSGMFGTIYSPPGTRIVLTSEEYKASNEYLLASVTGGDYHHFDCPIGAHDPDAPNAPSLFHRNFAFDFARDGPALDRVVDALDDGATATP
jgi:capsular polysaccharide biosynthesis protein